MKETSDRTRLDSIDIINIRLRKAYAIADLMTCKSEMPLQDGTLQELGEELCNHIKAAKAELDEMFKIEE